MLYKNIPAAEAKLFSKLVFDYIEGNPRVSPFYKYRPVIKSFDEVIKNRAFDSSKRAVLVDVLLEQYAKIGASVKNAKLVFENIQKLKEENTYTVTTGHQLALFTGPLFFIYKIITTIRLADELAMRYPNQNFVPVFWMASEDHDFAEINHVVVKGHKLEWHTENNNQPVGRLLTKGIRDVIAELKSVLGEGSDLIQLFEQVYTETNSLSDATLKLVHALFGDQGLIILEPDAKALKAQFTQVMKDDILHHSSFKAIIETNGKLTKDYKLQVTGREINFFYISEAGRNLMFKTPKGFEVQNTKLIFSEAEIEQEINLYPERFSPNVVLRPVYQECILPNLAYIGGPGEIAYWLQLKDVFETHRTDFPMVVLRNSVMLLHQSSIHKLEKRKVAVEQLLNPSDLLVKNFVSIEHPISLDTSVHSLNTVMQAAIDQLMAFDNQLGSEMIGLKKKTLDEMEKLQRDLLKRKKAKSESDIQILIAIREELFPNNQPQERYDTLISFASNYPKVLLNAVGKTILPLSHTVDIMAWN